MARGENAQRNDSPLRAPWASDPEIGPYVVAIIAKHGCRCAVETGTYAGATAVWFSHHLPTHTIEINPIWAGRATAKFWEHDIALYCGSSPYVLRNIVPRLQHPAIFLLDAHWGQNWPLFDELDVLVANKQSDAVIIIHDAKVPGRDDLHYDTWYRNGKSVDIELAAIESRLIAIYGEGGYSVSYNEKSAPKHPGIMFVEPMEKTDVTQSVDPRLGVDEQA